LYTTEIRELVQQGLLVQDEIGIRLTERGRTLANQVFLRFV
jgi:coproporphyrinogen III oxidase-like Fe-S oxidoreductase